MTICNFIAQSVLAVKQALHTEISLTHKLTDLYLPVEFYRIQEHLEVNGERQAHPGTFRGMLWHVFATLYDNYLCRQDFSSYAIALNKSKFVKFYLLTQLAIFETHIMSHDSLKHLISSMKDLNESTLILN